MADELQRALLLRDLELMGQPRNPNAVQPGRAGLLDLGVGLQERLGLLNQMFNPVEAIGGSMRAGREMMAPNASGYDRLASLGDMLSGVAGVVAPVAAGARAGVPAATSLMESLLGGSPDEIARFAADEAGSLPGMGIGLPTPRTDAEAMARDILQLRAEGRAGEVTDQMRAAADPQYMYFNTPLPMDYASRMARAAGRRDEFHGTTTGSDMTYADAFRGSGTRQGIGFVTSDNPYVSSSYADPQFGSVFPMLNQPIPENAPRLDLGGSVWSEIPEDLPVALGDRTVPARQIAAGPADVGGVFSTNQISRGASFDYPSVEFSNILDRSIHAPRPRTDDGMDIMREFQRLSSEPSTVTMRHDTRGMRSRFALFDPEFAHLRNLSASLAAAGVPLGLLSMLPEEEQY